MSLSITVTRSWNFPAGRPVTLAALRLGALPGVSIAGSVNTGDIAAGAITPALTSPGAYFYGALAGTNTYTLTLNPSLGAYTDGADVLGKVANSNTGAATATLNVNGLGAKNIYQRSGQLVKAGDLVANDIIRFRYNSSRNAAVGGWDIMEVLPSSDIRPAANVTTGSVNAQSVVNVPPLTAYASGVLLLVTVGPSLTNTAALTLTCDALAARNVRRQDGSALLSQDWVAGQTYLLYDDGTQFILLGRVPDVAIVASARNLVIKNNTGTPNSKMDITADEVVMKTSDGKALLASAVSLTADIGLGVAVNGLDAGVEGADTWYYLWVISNGSTTSALISTSATAPVLPTGYVYKALVGQVRNNGSSNFTVTTIQDRTQWQVTQDIAATITGVTSYTALTGTPLTDFAKMVPPNAKEVFVMIGRLTNADFFGAVASDTSGNNEQIQHAASLAGTVNGMNGVCTFRVPMTTAQVFSWKVDSTSANGYKIQTMGFTF